MNLIASIASSSWAAGFRHVNCSRPDCNRWLSQRHLSARPVGITVRNNWYCSYRCVKETIEARFTELFPASNKTVERSLRMPLGLTLVSRGSITDEQLRVAKVRQQTTRQDIGDVLLSLGFVDEEQITAARSSMWSCPVYTPHADTSQAQITIPSTLMLAHAAVPMQNGASAGKLMIGFLDRVNYGLLYAVEQVTGCKTTPCFLTPSDHRAYMESEVQLTHELAYEEVMPPQQMTRIVCQHGARIDANAVVVARCGDYIWARLSGGKTQDLLFRVM